MPAPPANAGLRCLAVATFGCLAHAQSPLEQGGGQEPSRDELERLRERVEALERDRGERELPLAPVDLSGAEYASIDALPGGDASTRPWYENIRISGYGAFGYYDSGGAGGVPEGSFLVKEASLFVEAQVWENITFFSETWITRYLFDSGSGFEVGELYVKFSDLFGTENGARIGLKAGRIDVPFGEDYLRLDAVDDPLISLSAAAPWAIDEGVELFGRARALSWMLAVTNGNVALGGDDSQSKLWSGKIACDVSPDIYVSASALQAGDTDVSTIWFGRGLITPVGLFAGSTAGTSPSTSVGATLWEGDARLGGSRRLSLGIQAGGGLVDDEVDAFDRRLYWLQLERAVRLTPALSLTLRYSEIGTTDEDEGYLFEGDIFGSGDELGYDTHRMQRISGGFEYRLNPNAQFKIEVGHDRYDVIPGSPFDPANDDRLFAAVEAVVSF